MQTDIQVESARSVKEALEKTKTNSCDVIISDYQMAEKDGQEKGQAGKGVRFEFAMPTQDLHKNGANFFDLSKNA